MAERKQITLTLPTELVDSLDLAARDRCVGRNLLIETLLTQGLRHLMPADAYMFGVELSSTDTASSIAAAAAVTAPDTKEPTDG